MLIRPLRSFYLRYFFSFFFCFGLTTQALPAQCADVVSEIEAEYAPTSPATQHAFRLWLALHKSPEPNAEANIFSEDESFLRWMLDTLKADRLLNSTKWNWAGNFLGRFGWRGKAYTDLRNHLIGVLENQIQLQSITIRQREILARFFVRANRTFHRWLRLTPIAGIENVDDQIKIFERRWNGSEQDDLIYAPNFFTISTPADLSISDFNNAMPFPISFLGIQIKHAWADGQYENPEGFMDHDRIHARGSQTRDSRFHRGAISEEYYLEILSRIRFLNRWVAFTNSKIESMRKIHEAIHFYAFHELYVPYTPKDLLNRLQQGEKEMVKGVRKLVKASAKDVLHALRTEVEFLKNDMAMPTEELASASARLE